MIIYSKQKFSSSWDSFILWRCTWESSLCFGVSSVCRGISLCSVLDQQVECSCCGACQGAGSMSTLCWWVTVDIVCPFHGRQTGHKKKLNAYIGFSESLDMEPYVEHKGTVFDQAVIIVSLRWTCGLLSTLHSAAFLRSLFSGSVDSSFFFDKVLFFICKSKCT